MVYRASLVFYFEFIVKNFKFYSELFYSRIIEMFKFRKLVVVAEKLILIDLSNRGLLEIVSVFFFTA